MSESAIKMKSAMGIAIPVAIIISLLITYLRPWPEVGEPDFTFDPKFGIPEPPKDSPYSRKYNIIASIFMGLNGLVGATNGFYDLVKTRSPLHLLISLSGTLIAIPEVFVDVMGLVYYPWEPALVAYKILGREMPPWVIFGWFGYGSVSLAIFKMLNKNPKTKIIWLTWLVLGIADVVFEEILLLMNVYHYYGNQPLVLIHLLPWWWIPCNSLGVLLAASLTYRYQRSLHGWKSVFALFASFASVPGVYGFIALPAWIVVQADYGWFITQMGGLAVWVLGFFAFYFIVDLVLERDPFDLDGRRRNTSEHNSPGDSERVNERSPLLDA